MGKKVTVINALQNKNELGRDATVLQYMRSWLAMCMWAKKEPNLTEYQNWRKKSETIDYRYLVPEFDKTLSTAAEEGQRKGRAPSNAVYWGPSFSLVRRQWWFCRAWSNPYLTCVPWLMPRSQTVLYCRDEASPAKQNNQRRCKQIENQQLTTHHNRNQEQSSCSVPMM